MLNQVADQLQALLTLIQANMFFSLMIVAILWAVMLVNAATQYRLNALGLLPRSLRGLIGIFISPFLHGNFNHLFFNSIPIFLLSNFILIKGHHQFYCVSLTIIVLSGAAIWLVGRRAIHIGASGVIMGYWGYLLINAYQQTSVTNIMLAIITLYYFAGLLLNLFPTDKQSSWEGHVFGFLAGIAASFLC